MIKLRLLALCDSSGCSSTLFFEAPLPLVLSASGAPTPKGWRYLRPPEGGEATLHCASCAAGLSAQGWQPPAPTPEELRAAGGL